MPTRNILHNFEEWDSVRLVVVGGHHHSDSKSYPPEFRRKVLDLFGAGRKVADVAADLGVTQALINVRRRQYLIHTGRMPG